MGRRPTIYDVAREAEVSASTVSRAYARPGRVNGETAAQIFQAAERLGYRSTAGRRPAPGPVRNAIALVVADVTNPFYGDIIKGAYEAAREAGFQLMLSHTNESPTVERETIERELGQVDGVVIASSRMTDSALRMVAKQKAVVLLNRNLPEASCVLIDAERGIRRSVEHLATLGHDRITYVAGPETSWSDGVRWRALQQVAAELRLVVRRLGPYEPTVLAGRHAAIRVVELDSTAVQAYNDQLAIGIVKGLRQLGVSCPEQVSVVGFDNIGIDELVEPALTTVASPLFRMGFTGVRNCIAVAQGAHPSGQPLMLPVRLVVRQSTASLMARSGRRAPLAPMRTTGDATPSSSPRSARPPRS
jgi:DNA-binding LacI/PurR family transcriptional regulator